MANHVMHMVCLYILLIYGACKKFSSHTKRMNNENMWKYLFFLHVYHTNNNKLYQPFQSPGMTTSSEIFTLSGLVQIHFSQGISSG